MEEQNSIHPVERITKHFQSINPLKQLMIVVGVSVVLGVVSGYILSSRGGASSQLGTNKSPATAQQDTRTFRDFAEGTLIAKEQPKDPSEYSEGTHFLKREGAVPVALTSSVVDLSKYEGKKVKVFGETQKAIKEGWLMDVGKIEEIK